MNRQWLLHERPVGMIGPEHFKYVETDIPEPGDGEVLIRNLMFSFDPTQRGWTMDRESYLPPVQIGEPMRAGCVAQARSQTMERHNGTKVKRRRSAKTSGHKGVKA